MKLTSDIRKERENNQMFVYIVLYADRVEGSKVVGVFSDSRKAKEYEVSYSANLDIVANEYGYFEEWVTTHEVELDKCCEGLEYAAKYLM